MRVRLGAMLGVGLVVLGAGPAAQQSTVPAASVGVVLRPTLHPRLPSDPAQFWMAPVGTRAASAAAGTFVSAVKLGTAGNYTKALPLLTPALLREDPLADYVAYYRGLAQLRIGKTEDARRTFQAVTASRPVGFLAEASALREAEADETLGDERAALAAYERLANMKTSAPDDVLMRLGRAAKAVGDSDKALAAFSRVYFQFPFSDEAPAAGLEIDRLPNREPITAGTVRFQQELARAEQLFAAKRYGMARVGFEAVRGAAQGDDRELVALRIAECDYFLKRPRTAADALRPYTASARRLGEARFFYALSLRETNNRSEYLRLIREIVQDFPNESWAEEALNNLATYYIIQDDDAKADETFRELLQRFPMGPNAERAGWKIGWTAYRQGQFGEAVRVFESAATRFARSDYRPAWLYWSARAHEALGEGPVADARYRLVTADYRNSYYGRLALERLEAPATRQRTVAAPVQEPPAQASTQATSSPVSGGPTPQEQVDGQPVPVAVLPPNQQIVRSLLGLGLYEQAMDELHFAQKAWGDSAGIQATLAWIYEQQGRLEAGERQFTLYRAAINTMKRAYPQFMASGGEALPKDLLRVIFPLGYWDLIKKYSADRSLDPYLVAALMAQESTFVPGIVSYAKAVGLMQLEAATARQYARKLGLRYSPKLLTTPDSNIKLGTAFLADSIGRFGEAYLVLASYNAGPGAVRRWMAERPNLPRDEFIDDIPFPQTQGYVKKILGTAEDYRVLYALDADITSPAPTVAVPASKAPSAATRSTNRTARPSTSAPSSGSSAKKKPTTTRARPRKAA